MPSAPTAKMRRLADRRLDDVVTVAVRTTVVPTRAQMAAGGDIYGTGIRYRAAVREQAASEQAGVTVDRVVRDLTVWIDDPAGDVTAGDRMTFTTTRDDSITGQAGTVLTVSRDSLRAVRRCVVRLGNDD